MTVSTHQHLMAGFGHYRANIRKWEKRADTGYTLYYGLIVSRHVTAIL